MYEEKAASKEPESSSVAAREPVACEGVGPALGRKREDVLELP